MDEMKAVAGNVYVCTDDGTYGFHGNGCQQLQALIDEENIMMYVSQSDDDHDEIRYNPYQEA